MDIVGAFEAKTHFSALLERVSLGEHITVTRHGMPIAKIVPVDGHDRQAVRTAITRLKKFAKKGRPLGMSIRTLREKGRG